MSNHTLSVISYFSVCIPFFAGFFAFKKADRDLRPFFYFLYLITFSDLAIGFSLEFFPRSRTCTLIGNINSLAEAFVITWLLKRWQVFEHKERQYTTTLFIFYSTMWLIESAYYGILEPNLYFPLTSQLIIGLLVISLINRMAAKEKEYLLLNAKFIICVALIIYYCLGIIPGVFRLNFLRLSNKFKSELAIVYDYMITMSYLIFTYALILIARSSNDNDKGNKNNVSLKNIPIAK